MKGPVSPENNITIPTFVSFFEPASDITGQECRFLGAISKRDSTLRIMQNMDSCMEKKKKKNRSWIWWAFMIFLLWYRFNVGYRNTFPLWGFLFDPDESLLCFFLCRCTVLLHGVSAWNRFVWYRFSSAFRNRGKWRWFAWEFLVY